MTDLPDPRMTAAGLTDIGRLRDLNEDGFLIEDELGLLLVTDGMGGHQAGDVASRMAGEVFSDFIYEYDPEMFSPTAAGDGPLSAIAGAVIQGAVANANRKIHDANRHDNLLEGSGMGTTVAGLWVMAEEARVAVFHVGDSRLYRYRGGRLECLTRDHSLRQEWRDGGCQGEPPKRNVITRALGPWPEVTADVSLHELSSGDMFLACTDGLTTMVEDDAIERRLDGAPDLEAACRGLVAMANDNGGKDNITVVLGRYT